MKPNLNYILILPDPVVESTLIITPDTVQTPFIKGTVVETGDGCYNQRTGEFRPVQVKKGDKVTYMPNVGYLVDNDGQSCVLIREEEIFTSNGKPINNWIGVKFDEKHNKTVNIGGVEIIRPETWVYQEFDDKTMYEDNKNLKETKPQIATIINPNSKYGLQNNDLVFVHYLQYTSSVIIDGIKYIPFNTIFFKINGKDDFEMADDVYLAKEVIIEAPKSDFGIFLTPTDDKKEPLKLKITHVPRNSDIKVGDIIITEDDYQYTINVYGETYVKITPEWIVATTE